MIKLEITILPKSSKHLEFSQTLDFIKPDLERLCSSLEVSKKNKTFTIMLIVNSVKKLMVALHSKELRLLSGAISTLGEKSQIVIHEGEYQRKGSDIKEIWTMYANKDRKKTNTNK